MTLDSEFQQGHDNELSPAILHLTEDFRRRLGALDPQQVAIWREMTPARKLQLLFQLWHFALKVAWTTERQWHPDLSPEELSRRVWRRIHGSEVPYVSTGRPT